MTSEPDSKQGRRPPTIDLKATEVGEPASPKVSPEPPPDAAGASTAPKSAGRLKSHAVSAGIGAIAMAAIVAALWFKGFVPSHQPAAPPDTTVATAPPAATAPDNAAPFVAAPVAAPSVATTSPATPPNADTDAQAKSLADSLAALGQRVDDIAGTSQSAAKSAAAAQSAADAANKAAQADVQHSDFDALANRMAALESAVKTLSDNLAHPVSGANDQAARLTVAAEALRAAVERGAPYQAELAAVQSLGVDQSATAPLASFAAGGGPSAAALARELAALLPALEHAADTAPGDTSFLGRLEASARKLVRITPVDAPLGDDPSAVIGRLTIDAERADITAALADVAALPDSAKPATAGWVEKAQARNAAIAASRGIAADALAALSKPAAQ
jgi:hypothetical protein